MQQIYKYQQLAVSGGIVHEPTSNLRNGVTPTMCFSGVHLEKKDPPLDAPPKYLPLGSPSRYCEFLGRF